MNELNGKYIPYIDGARGMAIAIVVLSHAGLGRIIPGKFGVTLFFFISGYLITKLLLLELKTKGQIQLSNFYLRRFFRLYPALLGMIAVSLLTAFSIQCSLPVKDIMAALFYFTNYYIGWFRNPGTDCSRILDIIWSLSVEEHFYFFFPFLFGAFLKKGRKKDQTAFLWVLFGLCFIALLARMELYYSHQDDLSFVTGRVYFSSHTRMDSILWGCIAAFLQFGLFSPLYYRIIHNPSFTLLGCILLFLSVAIRYPVFRETLLFTFQGVGLLLLIPSIGISKNKTAIRFFENSWLVFVGKISYSLYLFHWVALKLSNYLLPEFSIGWHLVFWTVTLLLTLSSYYFIEKPFVALRRKFGSHMQK